MFPRGHPSVLQCLMDLRANISKDYFRCIVVDDDLIELVRRRKQWKWRSSHNREGASPRIALSIATLTKTPQASFEHCSSIAREVRRYQQEDPEHDVLIMTEDVASAYRYAYTHSSCVYFITGHIVEDNALVIDMSAAFGWTGSAGFYSALGGAVAFGHESTRDYAHLEGYYYYLWVDDHVNVATNVATNVASRCTDIDISLRHAMVTIMGPAAVNNKKFTGWSAHQQMLGLIFTHLFIAMPAPKISKSQRLVASAFHSTSLTRNEYRPLLESLRHVAACIRPASALLHRLRSKEYELQRRTFSPALTGVPLKVFAGLQAPNITIVTVASDSGICALVPHYKLALSDKFPAAEQALMQAFNGGSANHFDINYRELLACAFAIHHKDHPQASPLHIHFRIDNTSAVPWQSEMASKNPRASILIRLLCMWEHEFGIRLSSSSHIQGFGNTTADAGESGAHAQKFIQLTNGWSQVPPPSDIATLEWTRFSVCESARLQIPPSRPTQEPTGDGRNGLPGAALSEGTTSTYGLGAHLTAIRELTVKTYLCGIRHFLVAAGQPMSSAIHRCANSSGASADSTHRDARRLQYQSKYWRRVSHRSTAAPQLIKRFKGAVSGGFLPVSSFALNASDIVVSDSAGTVTAAPPNASRVQIQLRGSKTNQGGAPVIRALSRSEHCYLCPLFGAFLLKKARGTRPGESQPPSSLGDNEWPD
ncbi:hypothetical protein P3T76_008103 [Phytophthora citrophthora]|uniref:Uncharacterized protein n=1 Tax=Phytophthora citrophthora TaxID=4793 RepID=A0AAD9GLD3_9STRA|nr:hypothetical protein P3T76_008103 [Phytophthora citrophthora]